MGPTKLSTVALCALLLFSGAAAAEQILLAPRYAAGDSYLLSLETTTDIDALSRGKAIDTETLSRQGRIPGEAVALHYEAAVIVLEVDGDGRAVRERHERVRLTYQRPEGSGSLFQSGAGYEVRRDRDGDLRIFAGEQGAERIDRKVERIVAKVLRSQFEYSGLPQLLDPGRPVQVGESWTLDPKLARKLLRERGLRVIEFGEPASASLATDPGSADLRVLHYSIPVAWLELRDMPANTHLADSEARLEGEVVLSGDLRARSHSETLALHMNGAVVKTGVARAFAWRLESTERVAQRTHVLGRVLISGL